MQLVHAEPAVWVGKVGQPGGRREGWKLWLAEASAKAQLWVLHGEISWLVLQDGIRKCTPLANWQLGVEECQGQHLACQVPEVPLQHLDHRRCDALVNRLVRVQVVVECEVIPCGIYGCVTGQPPRCVDVRNEVAAVW